ncbi:MAG: DNA polymerase III subunit alpha [Ignavibacteria bacterium]|nr:DNA polymerase III subunit alpha [Ignavibacteria bacterium]
MSEFVHLHNHTSFSLLDAACTPKQLINAAVADGQKALALTDHGVMFGCFEFYKYAKKVGVKPIIGCEVYLAVGKMTDKERVMASGKKRNYYHLVLLAKNEAGYKNLIKLTSIGHTAGYYYKPRIDFDLLRKHHEGLIATSACLSGPINAPLLNNDYDKARENALTLKEIFGDDFYVELQDHGLPEDKVVLEQAPRLAKELGIKIVVSNDAHYIKQENAAAHNVLLHITRDASFVKETHFDVRKDLRYRVPEMYLKSQNQMVKLFKKFPEGIDSTLEIAEKIDLTIPTTLQMPQFPIPEDSGAATLEDYLEELTRKGLEARYPNVTQDILDRASFELSVINKMGYAGYFLIVEDFIRAARDMSIRVGPGRGSAAGSIVAYALRITDIDPIKFDLLFERFLNPERVSMPDIDVDFSDDKRDKVIDYVKRKYGSDSVAQIITFGTLSSRAVLKDVGRVLGIELSVINSITDKIPVVLGKVPALADALELPELKWVKESQDKRIKDLIEFSLTLEGLSRNSSLHAAGVVIAPGPVSDFVPVYQTPTTEPATQYDMKNLEEAGLLKMDFLGLRTLSIIDNTLLQIKNNYGVDVDLDTIDQDLPAVYAMFSKGQTTGIFQFESDGMQSALRRLKPTCLDDLIAMNALYRPGPMANIDLFIDRKHGISKPEYAHPAMEPILNKTYGVIVYQEQVMQLVQTLAGFSLSQADIMRRAMGKKDTKIMQQQQDLFVVGAKKTLDISEELAAEIFAMVAKFADYGFNKSHSAAYAYLAFQTAWLKVQYPAEFLAANMSAELNDQKKIVSLMDEARRYGISILPPDVNRSMATFVADKTQIYFGMAGIKGVGVNAVEGIITARNQAPFNSIFDFTLRIDSKISNKRVLEALVCSGAFDSIQNGNRAQLFAAIEPAMEYSRRVHSGGMAHMDSLFGGGEELKPVEPELPNIPQWPENERLSKEREVLNFYVSGHPLQQYTMSVRSFSSFSIGNAPEFQSGKHVKLCGMIVDVRTRLDKRDNTIAFVKAEQFNGSFECVFWNDKYKLFGHLLRPEAVLVFCGKVEIAGDSTKMIVDEVFTIDDARKRLARGYVVELDVETATEESLVLLKNSIPQSSGQTSITFHVKKPGGDVDYIATVNGEVSDQTTVVLCKIFSEGNVHLQT